MNIYDPIRDAPTPFAFPFYVVAIRPDVMLHDGPDGDEGLATWCGYLAGPFGTFTEAEDALPNCGSLEGERLAIYSTREQVLSIPEGPPL